MTAFVGYIAMSIDGRIADGEGKMDWLQPFGDNGSDNGYAAFYGGIDALVMGRTTYDFVRDSGAWPYARKTTHVVTSEDFDPGRKDVRPVPPDYPTLRAHLVEQGVETVWIVGGGITQRAALDAGMLDALHLFVMPVVLGSGPLVFADGPETPARLTGHRMWPGGVTELIYDFGAA